MQKLRVADIGAAVRRQRKGQGLRQEEAAGLLGVGVRFLSELERGKPSLEIAKVLQVLEGLSIELRLIEPGSSTASTMAEETES